MKGYRFIHRQTNKTIILVAVSFTQAISDLHSILEEKADDYRFLELS